MKKKKIRNAKMQNKLQSLKFHTRLNKHTSLDANTTILIYLNKKIIN